MKKIIIIGSGLSGLSFYRYINKNIYNVQCFEKNNYPGGRVHTEDIDGFKCDIGFQVLLNNYSEVKKLNIYNKLDLQYFNSGAEMFSQPNNLKIYNPLIHPLKFLKSDIFKIFSAKDMLKLLLLFTSKNLTESKVANLFKNRFTEKSQRLFLKPFFKGILLSESLNSDTSFFLKVFKKFATGRASVPLKGMHTLPESIINQHNIDINYNHELVNIENNFAYFSNGKKYEYDILVIASPLHSIKKFININIPVKYNSNKTIYISSSKKIMSKSILLVPDEKFHTNSIQCLTNISNGYSKNDKSLYSLSTLNINATDDELLNEFKRITGLTDNKIQLVKSYVIKHALPQANVELKSKDNIHFCGDWNTEPSIDGALKSGRILAEFLNKLK